MAINKLKGAGNGQVIQAGTSFEVGTKLELTTSWGDPYITTTDSIQTRFKSEDDFLISHVNDDANKVFLSNDVIVEGEGVTVYLKSAGGTIDTYVLINKGLGMYGV